MQFSSIAENIPWEEHDQRMKQWRNKWKLERPWGKMSCECEISSPENVGLKGQCVSIDSWTYGISVLRMLMSSWTYWLFIGINNPMDGCPHLICLPRDSKTEPAGLGRRETTKQQSSLKRNPWHGLATNLIKASYRGSKTYPEEKFRRGCIIIYSKDVDDNHLCKLHNVDY
jgi:hypothetical protein